MADYAFLQKEVLAIDRFLHSMVTIKLAVPKVQISKEIRDAEEYGEGVITLNPNYSKGVERISAAALLAHGYFHHVQHSNFKFYDPEKLWNKLRRYNLRQNDVQDLVSNIFESSAMFFAVAYLTRKDTGSKRVSRIFRYLNSKAYIPPSTDFISGNAIMLLSYSANKYDVKKTIRQSLTYGGQAKMARAYMDTKK